MNLEVFCSASDGRININILKTPAGRIRTLPSVVLICSGKLLQGSWTHFFPPKTKTKDLATLQRADSQSSAVNRKSERRRCLWRWTDIFQQTSQREKSFETDPFISPITLCPRPDLLNGPRLRASRSVVSAETFST